MSFERPKVAIDRCHRRQYFTLHRYMYRYRRSLIVVSVGVSAYCRCRRLGDKCVVPTGARRTIAGTYLTPGRRYRKSVRLERLYTAFHENLNAKRDVDMANVTRTIEYDKGVGFNNSYIYIFITKIISCSATISSLNQ